MDDTAYKVQKIRGDLENLRGNIVISTKCIAEALLLLSEEVHQINEKLDRLNYWHSTDAIARMKTDG